MPTRTPCCGAWRRHERPQGRLASAGPAGRVAPGGHRAGDLADGRGPDRGHPRAPRVHRGLPRLGALVGQEHVQDLHTELLFFPRGADVITLYGSDLLSPLLLRWVPASPVLLYNLWVVALLGIGGGGVAALGRRLGGTWGGAAVAATAWVSAPFFQHELLNGTSELLAAGFLPWFARAVLDSLDRPAIRSGVTLGLVTALGVAASAYNLFFMLVIGLCILLHRLSTTRPAVLTRDVLREGARGRRGVRLDDAHGLVKPATARANVGASPVWLEQDPPLPDSFAWLRIGWTPARRTSPAGAAGGGVAYWTTCTVFPASTWCRGPGWSRANGATPGRRGRTLAPSRSWPSWPP